MPDTCPIERDTDCVVTQETDAKARIVRTVAASPSLTGVAILAVFVLIRTFLSFSLEVETTGRWPWQKRDIAAS